MHWFLYDNGPRHERVKPIYLFLSVITNNQTGDDERKIMSGLIYIEHTYKFF